MPPEWTSSSQVELASLARFWFTLEWCCAVGEVDYTEAEVTYNGQTELVRMPGNMSQWEFDEFGGYGLEEGGSYDVKIFAVNSRGRSEPLTILIDVPKLVAYQVPQSEVEAYASSAPECARHADMWHIGWKLIRTDVKFLFGEFMPLTEACTDGSVITQNTASNHVCRVRQTELYLPLNPFFTAETGDPTQGHDGAPSTFNRFSCSLQAEVALEASIKAMIPLFAEAQFKVGTKLTFGPTASMIHNVDVANGQVTYSTSVEAG